MSHLVDWWLLSLTGLSWRLVGLIGYSWRLVLPECVEVREAEAIVSVVCDWCLMRPLSSATLTEVIPHLMRDPDGQFVRSQGIRVLCSQLLALFTLDPGSAFRCALPLSGMTVKGRWGCGVSHLVDWWLFSLTGLSWRLVGLTGYSWRLVLPEHLEFKETESIVSIVCDWRVMRPLCPPHPRRSSRT